MNKLSNLSKTCKEFFITKAETISIETGFIKRKRKITGSAFLKTMVLSNIGDASVSIDSMCHLLNEDKIEITKQGLDFRFSNAAVKFMQATYH